MKFGLCPDGNGTEKYVREGKQKIVYGNRGDSYPRLSFSLPCFLSPLHHDENILSPLEPILKDRGYSRKKNCGDNQHEFFHNIAFLKSFLSKKISSLTAT